MLTNLSDRLKSYLAQLATRRLISGCLAALYVPSVSKAVDASDNPQIYQLLTGEPLVPSDMTEDDGDHLGWIMALAGDGFKEHIRMALPSKIQEDLFNEDGTSDLVLRSLVCYCPRFDN